MMGATPGFLVICVNYNNARETSVFVRSLLALEGTDQVDLLVVDNSDRPFREPQLLCLPADDPRVKVLSPGRNLGYFGAAAWGLRQHVDSAGLPDWVIVVNTDIAFPQPDFFVRLQSRYRQGGAAVIAPAIHSSRSGKDQNPNLARRPSALQMHLYKWLFAYYPTFVLYQRLSALKQRLSRLRRGGSPPDPAGGSERPARPIYAAHGAFLIFHRSYFEAGGSLNHGVFLFGEEIFVAETARRLGLPVIYDPNLRVVHREHATTGTLSRKIAQYVAEASRHSADHYFG